MGFFADFPCLLSLVSCGLGLVIYITVQVIGSNTTDGSPAHLGQFLTVPERHTDWKCQNNGFIKSQTNSPASTQHAQTVYQVKRIQLTYLELLLHINLP